MTPVSSDRITQAVLAVFRVNGRLAEWGDGLVRPLGLTSARWQMLGALALSDGPRTAPQMAAAMGVTRQGAQKQLDLLVQNGLIGSQPNPRHKRSPLYFLTERGVQVYKAADRLWSVQAGKLAAIARERDVAATLRTLGAMETWLDSSMLKESK